MRHPRKLLFAAGAGIALLLALPIATALGIGDAPGRQGTQVQALTALDTSFTFQGRLLDGGKPANGTYDLRFIMYDAEVGGSAVGTTIEKADVVVTDGIFTVDLDYGDVFTGNAYWIEVSVRAGTSTGAYAVLAPRTPIQAVPYALAAKRLGFGADVTGNGDSGFAITNSSTTGTALSATGGGATSTALEVDNGAITVGGAVPPAFLYTVTTIPATCANCAVLDNALINGDPNAIVLLTNVVTGTTALGPISVRYDATSGKWWIVGTGAMTAGTQFNLLVLRKG
jgi:hypothetical protein